MHRVLHETVWGAAVVCDLRQTIQMYDKRRNSFGKYVRGGLGGGKLRLTLQVPAGDLMNTLVQVSDGELLTSFDSISAKRTQVDLGKIRERLTISPQALQDPVVAMYLAIGGQAEMIRRLCQQYQWEKISEGQLGENKVYWLGGQLAAHPAEIHAKAPIDLKPYEDGIPKSVPMYVKLAIGHPESAVAYWVHQIELWDDGHSQQPKSYILTEWDSPKLLTAEQLGPELFRLGGNEQLTSHETRDETKAYLPPAGPSVARTPAAPQWLK